ADASQQYTVAIGYQHNNAGIDAWIELVVTTMAAQETPQCLHFGQFSTITTVAMGTKPVHPLAGATDQTESVKSMLHQQLPGGHATQTFGNLFQQHRMTLHSAGYAFSNRDNCLDIGSKTFQRGFTPEYAGVRMGR